MHHNLFYDVGCEMFQPRTNCLLNLSSQHAFKRRSTESMGNSYQSLRDHLDAKVRGTIFK